MLRRQPLVDVAVGTGFAVGYALSMVLGKATALPDSELALAWPPVAMATVWVLATRGLRRRVAVLAAIAVINTAVNAAYGTVLAASVGFGVLNTAHTVVVVAVLSWSGWRGARPLERMNDISTLAVASAAGSVVSAIGGGLVGWLLLDGSFLQDAELVGSRNAVSTFVCVATLLALPRLRTSGGPAGGRERLVLIGVTLAATIGVMSVEREPIAFALVPFTVLIALRCGPSISAVLAGLQGVVVVFATVAGSGPFADLPSPTARVLLAQALITILMGVGLALSIEDAERAGALARSREAEERLAHLALHDDLTGLPNRILARDRLGVALGQAARAGEPMALLFIDMDRFKEINDRFGHEGGDVVLKEVARRLGATVRPHDTVARIGGDEFLVICPAVGSPLRAEQIAERIIASLAEPVLVDGEPVPVTVSVGVTATDGRETDAQELMRRADGAMYTAKEQGRAGYVVSRAELRGDVERSAQQLDELRRAFEFGELVMEYQPIVDMATGEAVALEALVRWRHPERGLIEARDFVDTIESSDLVDELGALSLRVACADGAALRAAGHDLEMHVNISARQLEHATLADDVHDVLDDTGFPATSLVLEITESRSVSVSSSVVDRLAELRGLGVRIAIDDFGTGYSGLSRLISLPVDMVKLDRCFVDAIDVQRSARAVGDGLLTITREMDIDSVAEGVETREQEARLIAMGFRRAQGFLYSPALPSARLASWLRDQAA
ncbi:MAG TPA: EAL domain-containing protein [Nocardioides sp.]|nr:EAL domain-containing protein [Nocardioides sp.]